MDFSYNEKAAVTIQPVSANKDVLIPTTVEHINHVNA